MRLSALDIGAAQLRSVLLCKQSLFRYVFLPAEKLSCIRYRVYVALAIPTNVTLSIYRL